VTNSIVPVVNDVIEQRYCQTTDSANKTVNKPSETHNTTPKGYTPTKKTDSENLWIHRNTC